MSDTNIFEQASQQKLRFDTNKGQLSADDLWNLPLQSTTGKINLDDIARSISAKIKDSVVESFVSKATDANKSERLRLDIVKRVIEVKLEKAEKIKNQKAAAEHKQRLLDALSTKKAESLNNMSEDELKAELAKFS